MEKQNWPQVLKLQLSEGFEIELPLMSLGNDFYIYSFDMTGEAKWNKLAAQALKQKLSGYDYEGFVTVQTKSSGLCQELSRDTDGYLELRKAHKAFMQEPKHVTVNSITTQGQQELWIGKEKYARFQGKKLCFIDDVVSSGGTVDSALLMAKEIGFEITVIACVLTEGKERTDYKGIPLVALNHLPLPGSIANNE